MKGVFSAQKNGSCWHARVNESTDNGGAANNPNIALPYLNTLSCLDLIKFFCCSERFLQNFFCFLVILLASSSENGSNVSVRTRGPSLLPRWTWCGGCSALKSVTSGPGFAWILVSPWVPGIFKLINPTGRSNLRRGVLIQCQKIPLSAESRFLVSAVRLLNWVYGPYTASLWTLSRLLYAL